MALSSATGKILSEDVVSGPVGSLRRLGFESFGFRVFHGRNIHWLELSCHARLLWTQETFQESDPVRIDCEAR